MWLVYFLCFLFLSVMIDGEHINKGQYIESHFTRWLLRGVVIIGLSGSIFSFVAMILFWMALFDGMLNWEIDRDFLSVGNTAKWDIFWGKYPNVYYTMKVVTLLGAVVLTVISLIG